MSDSKTTVSLLKNTEYDRSELVSAVEKHFENLGGIENIIPLNSKVVIKPNLVSGEKPEKAVTVHPDFVYAIIEVVKRRTPHITLAESPGGPHNDARLKGIYKITGMADLDCEKVYEPTVKEIEYPEGLKCKTFSVIKEIAEADVLISAAKLKTHGMMAYTGAVKNLFGAIFSLEKVEYHFRYNDRADFSDMIIDLCLALKPTISFIDGIVGMEGEGPTSGTPKAANCTIAALNPFACDVVGASLIGIDERISGQLARSYDRGLTPRLEDINIVGDDFNSLKTEFEVPVSLENTVSFGFLKILPKGLRSFIERALSPKPVVVLPECIGCGKCVESCPQKTIFIKDNKAVIKYGNCIRCYCCQELCPRHAVEVRSKKIYKFKL